MGIKIMVHKEVTDGKCMERKVSEVFWIHSLKDYFTGLYAIMCETLIRVSDIFSVEPKAPKNWLWPVNMPKRSYPYKVWVQGEFFTIRSEP